MAWAILSGIVGNLRAYEAVLADVRQSRLAIDEMFILGDVIGPQGDNAALIKRLYQRRPGEPRVAVCQGWWEEQLLILHGLGRTGEPTALIEQYGAAMTKTLWDAVPRELVRQIQSWEFGIFELDCLLAHGSSLGVDDVLTPDTPVVTLVDRLQRMEANYLFCGRSGLTFDYEIAMGQIQSTVQTLDQPATNQSRELPTKHIVGVGNVGGGEQATYTLFYPESGQIQFQQVACQTSPKGFGR
ncbi:metallophosphatase [filamentous cyanobacterium LEGE 11480]|uniref:Metallophosphatase n=1 Tax=Romeriopsis navalis LEGE 11480 TaxID=2777977 RepID=A0A928Z1W9_9CYAN|nr:metallophosphatase [Romeriopsis navalis]MBE9028924.1 metallophosphatase [Romeriopsis navalis LEGE 11480]